MSVPLSFRAYQKVHLIKLRWVVVAIVVVVVIVAVIGVGMDVAVVVVAFVALTIDFILIFHALTIFAKLSLSKS